MIVADTCLVFHLFNQTNLTSAAEEVLAKDSNWILPPLWKEEYANILSKLARKEKQPMAKVIDHFEFTVNQLTQSEVMIDTKKALEISLVFKIRVYDAHFVGLAADYNAILVTEDKEILSKCPKLAVCISDYLSI